MPFSPKSLEEKPYNACLNCDHIGKKCDGPNFLTMSPERFGEWCQLRKKYKGWTLSQLAERTGVTEQTLNRIFTGKANDIKLSTMQALTEVLVDGSWGQYPCVWAADQGALDNDVAHLKEVVAREKEAVVTLKEQVAKKDKQLDERYELLKEREAEIKELKKSKKSSRLWNGLVGGLLAAALVYISFTLIVDYRNPYRGFWWMADGPVENHNMVEE